MPSPFRLITGAFRLTSLVACLTSIVAGATLPLAPRIDRHPNGRLFILKTVASGNSSKPTSTAALFKWNVEDKQLPLLSLPLDRLPPGFDQSITFPLGQFSFPIFQALNYDDEHGRYLLPTLSSENNGVHFIELEPGDIKNTFTSNDGTNIKLIDNDNLKTVRVADGTRYTFVRYPDGEYRCVGIKDPRGSYLNLIYTANGLMLHGVVDSFGRTITFNYASEGIVSVTQNWMANSEGLSKTWIVGESPAAAPAGNTKALEFATTKALPTNALVRSYSPEMGAADKLLANIFGGPNAVAAGNGFEPAGLAASYPLYRGDLIGDDGKVRRGHLSFAMHLYGNYDGTGESPLYVPLGFVLHSDQPSPTDAVVTFYYPRLGNLSDVTLAVFHVADFNLSDEGGRVRIGNLGGPGGSSAFYKHTHIEFYRGNTGLPPLSERPRLRIDPATVFANAKAAL
jgi:hypothetical protein